MIEDSLQRLARRTLDELPGAVGAGNFETLLVGFIDSIASDTAEYVYTASEGLKQANADLLIEEAGTGIVKVVHDAIRRFGEPLSRKSYELQALAIRSYYGRLSQLADLATTAGNA